MAARFGRSNWQDNDRLNLLRVCKRHSEWYKRLAALREIYAPFNYPPGYFTVHTCREELERILLLPTPSLVHVDKYFLFNRQIIIQHWIDHFETKIEKERAAEVQLAIVETRRQMRNMRELLAPGCPQAVIDKHYADAQRIAEQYKDDPDFARCIGAMQKKVQERLASGEPIDLNELQDIPPTRPPADNNDPGTKGFLTPDRPFTEEDLYSPMLSLSEAVKQGAPVSPEAAPPKREEDSVPDDFLEPETATNRSQPPQARSSASPSTGKLSEAKEKKKNKKKKKKAEKKELMRKEKEEEGSKKEDEKRKSEEREENVVSKKKDTVVEKEKSKEPEEEQAASSALPVRERGNTEEREDKKKADKKKKEKSVEKEDKKKKNAGEKQKSVEKEVKKKIDREKEKSEERVAKKVEKPKESEKLIAEKEEKKDRVQRKKEAEKSVEKTVEGDQKKKEDEKKEEEQIKEVKEEEEEEIDESLSALPSSSKLSLQKEKQVVLPVPSPKKASSSKQKELSPLNEEEVKREETPIKEEEETEQSESSTTVSRGRGRPRIVREVVPDAEAVVQQNGATAPTSSGKKAGTPIDSRKRGMDDTPEPPGSPASNTSKKSRGAATSRGQKEQSAELTPAASRTSSVPRALHSDESVDQSTQNPSPAAPATFREMEVQTHITIRKAVAELSMGERRRSNIAPASSRNRKSKIAAVASTRSQSCASSASTPAQSAGSLTFKNIACQTAKVEFEEDDEVEVRVDPLPRVFDLLPGIPKREIPSLNEETCKEIAAENAAAPKDTDSSNKKDSKPKGKKLIRLIVDTTDALGQKLIDEKKFSLVSQTSDQVSESVVKRRRDEKTREETAALKQKMLFMHRALVEHPFSDAFKKPVPASEVNYSRVVKEKVDLSMIKREIENESITSVVGVLNRSYRMLANAIMFNGTEHDVNKHAVMLLNTVNGFSVNPQVEQRGNSAGHSSRRLANTRQASSTRAGPSSSSTRAGSTASVTRAGSSSSVTRAAPSSSTTRAGPSSSSTRAAPSSSSTRAAPTSSSTRAGPSSTTGQNSESRAEQKQPSSSKTSAPSRAQAKKSQKKGSKK